MTSAQTGRVVYEETLKMEIELPPEMQHMEDQFPSERMSKKMLLFDDAASLMKAVPDEVERENTFQSDGVRIRMSNGSAEDEIYTDFDTGVLTQKTDFMGRKFLITGDGEGIAWKLTEERSTFLGYECQKATAVDEESEVEAWFTTEIPVPAGPLRYSGLPGLVLVASVDGGRMSFVATEVALDADVSEDLVPPKGGKKVTSDEYSEIVEEKMEEMGVERGGRRGGANIIIRRQ